MALCLTQIYYWKHYSQSSITLTILYLGVQIFTKYPDSFLNIFPPCFIYYFWAHNVLNVMYYRMQHWCCQNEHFEIICPRNINLLPRWLGIWKKSEFLYVHLESLNINFQDDWLILRCGCVLVCTGGVTQHDICQMGSNFNWCTFSVPNSDYSSNSWYISLKPGIHTVPNVIKILIQLPYIPIIMIEWG